MGRTKTGHSLYGDRREGAFHVVFRTHRRRTRTILGTVRSDAVELSCVGYHVEAAVESTNVGTRISIVATCVMPDHVHLVVVLRDAPVTLAQLVARIKGNATRNARLGRLLAEDTVLWQRGYYARRVRSAAELRLIVAYVNENPKKWAGADA